MNKIVFTSQENSCIYSLSELEKISEHSKLFKWLKPGVGILESDKSFIEISQIIMNKPLLFTRHIFPILATIEIYEDENDIDLIINSIYQIKEYLNEEKTFSTQAKILTKTKFSYKKFDLNLNISNYFQSQGYKLDIKNPQQVISIIIQDKLCLIGISETKYNLSNWTSGEHRFKYFDDQISRAEFKLMEAIDTFKIDLSNYKNALDLGAAPGGWTRILLEYDLKITAVDPGNLEESLKNNVNITHYKELAQNYVAKLSESKTFDVIVNDMRMDSFESCKLMGLFLKHLDKKGIVIITLKLPYANALKIANKSISVLRNWYEIVNARQLFHNRSEITLLLKPKNHF